MGISSAGLSPSSAWVRPIWSGGHYRSPGRRGVEGQDVGHPVFVAAGDSDPMILPHYSYLLAGLIPQAWVKIYPDSAHGFLFQYHAEFAADVEAFLSDRR